jgi:hypothetical protein
VPANFLDLAYRTFSTRGVSETGLVIWSWKRPLPENGNRKFLTRRIVDEPKSCTNGNEKKKLKKTKNKFKRLR